MNIEILKAYVQDLNKIIEGSFDYVNDSQMKDGYHFYHWELQGNNAEFSKELYTKTFDLTEKQFQFIYGDNCFDLNQYEKWLENILILINRYKLNDLVKGWKYLHTLSLNNAVDTPINELLENLITPDLDRKFWGNFLDMDKADLMPYLQEEFSLTVKEVNSIFLSDGVTEDSMLLMIKNINKIIEEDAQ